MKPKNKNMGSGTKRRYGDNVRIVPQKPRIVTGVQGGSRGRSQEDERGSVCPSSFRADLSRQVILGSHLTLKQDNGVLIIQAGSQEVGRLSKVASKKISDCILSGYHYEGVVKKANNGRQYAEFTQK